MDSVKKLEEKIAALKAELKTAKRDKEIAQRNPQFWLAEKIHNYQCHRNHVDDCTWEYSSWSSMNETRRLYLYRACRLLDKYHISDLDTVFDMANMYPVKKEIDQYLKENGWI